MYYRLKEPYSFKGWKKLPFAIRQEYGPHMVDRPYFFRKSEYRDLMYCNGVEDVDISEMSELGQEIINDMIEDGMIEKSETPMEPLKPYQRYKVFPTRYAEVVHWAITGKCNFKCRHCLVSAPDSHHPQLPLSDCIRIIDEIAACGIKKVDITGGEPLVRKDYPEIFKALKERGIGIGTMFTNASLLDEEVLENLDKYGHHPDFQLSFDGLGHHDWLRGVPGAEKQADAAFKLLQKHKVPVTASVMIHRENKDCLAPTARYLADLDVNGMRVNAPQELGLWKQYGSQYALTEGEVWEVYAKYIQDFFAEGMIISSDLDGYFSCNKGETKYKIPYVRNVKEDADLSRIPYCDAVSYTLHIRPDGRVCPCMGFSNTKLGDTFPNVLDEHLGDIMLKSSYQDVVETNLAQVKEHNPDCRECELFPRCAAGCMTQSMTEDGDYMIHDQRMCYFHKHIGEDAVRKVADEAILKAGYSLNMVKDEI